MAWQSEIKPASAPVSQSTWQTPPVVEAPEHVKPDPNYNRNDALRLWQKAAHDLEVAKEVEINLRNLILSNEFKNASRGTNNLELGNGWILKAVIKENVKLDPNTDTVDAALAKMAKVGNEGTFLSERLVVWEQSLETAEYYKLNGEYKKIFDTVVTIKPGQGSLELVDPANKKKK